MVGIRLGSCRLVRVRAGPLDSVEPDATACWRWTDERLRLHDRRQTEEARSHGPCWVSSGLLRHSERSRLCTRCRRKTDRANARHHPETTPSQAILWSIRAQVEARHFLPPAWKDDAPSAPR